MCIFLQSVFFQVYEKTFNFKPKDGPYPYEYCIILKGLPSCTSVSDAVEKIDRLPSSLYTKIDLQLVYGWNTKTWLIPESEKISLALGMFLHQKTFSITVFIDYCLTETVEKGIVKRLTEMFLARTAAETTFPTE